MDETEKFAAGSRTPPAGQGATTVTSATALVVEDDQETAELVGLSLEQAGLSVTTTGAGATALELVRRLQPDLVTLDLSLPDMEGLEVCRRIRAISSCYVIVLSAREGEVDRVLSLEVGADDFLTKPASPRELRARAAAMFRRPRHGMFEATLLDGGGGLTADLDRREVHVDDAPVALTRTEFDLLAHLMERPGTVAHRTDIIATVWRSDFVDADHLLDVHVGNLRRKLRQHSRQSWIHTVRGVGYRFDRAD